MALVLTDRPLPSQPVRPQPHFPFGPTFGLDSCLSFQSLTAMHCLFLLLQIRLVNLLHELHALFVMVIALAPFGF